MYVFYLGIELSGYIFWFEIKYLLQLNSSINKPDNQQFGNKNKPMQVGMSLKDGIKLAAFNDNLIYVQALFKY